jgi:serine protease inhibitor
MKTICDNNHIKRFACVMALMLAVSLSACSPAPKPVPTATAPVAISEGSFADGRGVALSFKLLYALAGTDITNGAIGTAGIIDTLVAAKAGSAGETETALANVLGMQGVLPKDVSDAALNLRQAMEKLTGGKYAAAWGLFVGNNQPIKESFLTTAKHSLKLSTIFHPMEGEAGVKYLNEWADEATGGVIKKVGFTLPAAAAPFFVDVLSADPDWTTALDTGKSRPLPFTYESGEEKAVPTMVCLQNCGIYKGVDGSLAVLPCAEDKARLVIMVPSEGTSLRDFISLAAARHDDWLANAEWNNNRVLLPRFATEFEGSVMTLLESAGIGYLLREGKDYSALGEGLYFSDILHKAELIVDESGVEDPNPNASYRQGMKDDIPTLAVDKPFIVALEKSDPDRKSGTGPILAMGFVQDPLTAKLK